MYCETIKSDLQTKSLTFGLGSLLIVPHTFSFLILGCWIVKILEVRRFFDSPHCSVLMYSKINFFLLFFSIFLIKEERKREHYRFARKTIWWCMCQIHYQDFLVLPILENNFNTSQLNFIFKQQGVLAEANCHALMNSYNLLNYFKWMTVHLAF